MRLPVALLLVATATFAETDPATEASVLAVAKAMPTVVNINTTGVIQQQVRDPFENFFRGFNGRIRPPRVIQQQVQSLGTGFIVDASGYIVTNEHVVTRAEELKISVTTNDGKTYEARYITGEPATDLAFLKIDGAKPFPFISANDLSANHLGQTVLVLGNPMGYGSSVSRGILSAKNRTVEVSGNEYKGLIQTDAAINPGNSGGPVVDLAGKLVGVSSVKMAFTPQGVPTQGLGFAIPGDVVRDKVREFTKTAQQKPKLAPAADSLARKFFGVVLQDLTPELRKRFSASDDPGVLVADIERGSPAERAGMTGGLVVHQIGRYDVDSVRRIEEILAQISPGSLADFTVSVPSRVRGQLVRQLHTVTLTAR
ncbi:MAG: trypsin-like peptidase domain-containing protein [Chthoniobacteraceae bacterium]